MSPFFADFESNGAIMKDAQSIVFEVHEGQIVFVCGWNDYFNYQDKNGHHCDLTTKIKTVIIVIFIVNFQHDLGAVMLMILAT